MTDLWMPRTIGFANPIPSDWLTEMGEYLAPLDRQTAELQIVNDATLEILYSFTVPGGTLGSATPEGVLLGKLRGTYLNNTGATKTLLMELALGATTIWGDTSAAIATLATAHEWELDFMIWLQGATNAQQMSGAFRMSAGTAGSIAGIGHLGETPAINGTALGGTAAVDMSADQTLTVKVQHSAASASLNIKRELALLWVR